jgi:hypothetical protein
MKKTFFAIAVFLTAFTGFAVAQCTFDDLFPLDWKKSAFEVDEQFQSDPRFKVSHDTIRASAFKHNQDYFRTVRNMNLKFYAYKSAAFHECFQSGDITLICIANDSGLYAYSYMINYPAEERDTYVNVLDSLKSMMKNKYVYSSNVKNTLNAGNLSGEGVSLYYNNEPVIHDNLTYVPMVIRVGNLAQLGENQGGDGIPNQAGEIKYYRLEILFKKPMPK